jgi:signal transduction histidine kinase
VLLTGLGLVELVVQLEPTPARLLGTLLTTAPIALAAWRPYAALAVLFGVQLLDAALRRSDDFVVAALLAMMVSLFAVAVTRPARQALPGLAAGLVLANVGIALDPSTVAGDHVFAAILLTGPWLAGVAVHHWRRQAIELERVGQELRAAQDDRLQLGLTLERMRVARDLHDSTAQALNAVIVHAEAAEEALTRDPDGVAVALRRIQQVGRMALADTRQVVEALRGDGGDGEPRLAHLDRLVATFADTGLEVDCRVEETDAPLPAAV